MWRKCVPALILLLTLGVLSAKAQLLASDDFESYSSGPVGQSGGSGDWVGNWTRNSQNGGGSYLDSAARIDGSKSVGLYGLASATGESISRTFSACTNELTISWSMRGDFNADGAGAPSNARRIAFTIRNGDGASHFDNQRLSFFFAAGSKNFNWYDGANHSVTNIQFALTNIYNLTATLNPMTRAYSFSVSNRNNGATFSYTGTWTNGVAGDPIGSIAFMMRGPNGGGQNAYLDSVTVSAPDYVVPGLPELPLNEGAAWRYFKGRSMPAVQGEAEWFDPAYDDGSGWGSGESGFGYGGNGETKVFDDMQNSYLSVFFRTKFVVTNLTEIQQLNLGADYDDGFVAYLNGVEIARRNMPAGPVDHLTPALEWRDASRKGYNTYNNSGKEPQLKEYITVDPNLLVEGTNVLAVSGHNITTNSSDFYMLFELLTNATLVRGPYLQMPHQDHMSVIWHTAAALDSVVEYGYDENYADGVISNAGPERIHEVMLPVLPAGTTVYYRVKSGGEILGAAQFSAPKSAEQKFCVAVMSDYGGTSQHTADIVQQAVAKNPDLLITSGDNCQEQSAPPGLFDSHWFTPLSPLISRVPFMPTIGNHDIRTQQGSNYVNALSLPMNGPPGEEKRNYSFDYGNIHFVMIDGNTFEEAYETTYSNAPDRRPAVISWLTNDLHNTTQTWKIASFHQPPYTSRGPHPDTAPMKDYISPILEQYGVQIAFQGHNHFYERINPINGVYYFTVGSGGFSSHALTEQREFSFTVISNYDFLVFDVDGSHLKLRNINQYGVEQDSYDFDLSHPFKMDGILDDTNWQRAENRMKLNAAIRGPYLYVATQDAGEGSDNFIYVATNSGPMRAFNWAKSGQAMQWGAYLADENGGLGQVAGYYSWFDAAGQAMNDPSVARAVTPGLNNNGVYSNGVLEGTLDLSAYFGSFPSQLWLAAAPVQTDDGGALVSSAQVPASVNNDGNLDPSEFLVISTRDLALDAPVADAGEGSNAEAGYWLDVDGSQSTSPSGLPTTYTWTQVSGPTGEIENPNSLHTRFRLTNDIAEATSVVLRLTVFDSRFSDEDTVQLAFGPILDSDGDGLSDQEELTGVDNPLTPINPNGHITNPNNADSDGDGVPDGEEAVAGTDPNDSDSKFELVNVTTESEAGPVIRWSSVSGRTYNLWSTTDLLVPNSWSRVAENLTATPPINTFTAAAPVSAQEMFAVEAIAP